MVYVSITGLEITSPRHSSRFWWHAVRSMNQAREATGNISAEARTVNSVHHTLSVWTNEAAMRAYLSTGAHLQAMKAFPSIATGKTLGFNAEQPPHWDDVHALWAARGRVVAPRQVRPV